MSFATPRVTALSLLRPTQRGGVFAWLLGVFLLLGVAVVGGAIGYWLFLNLLLGMTISHQPVAITLPPELTVQTDVTNVVDIRMNGIIHAQVPFDKPITVPMQGEYTLDVSMDAQVPLQFTIHYNGILPIDTYADITARTDLDFRTLKHYDNILIKARIPLKLNLPVSLTVPIDETIRFKYDGPLTVVADDELHTRVNTVLSTELAVDQNISTPIIGSFGLRLHLPQEPIKAVIEHSDLKINPATLRLEIAEDTEGPERMASPFGPAAD